MNKTRRVLLTAAQVYPSVGGIENSLRYIARGLCDLGYDVGILAFQSHPQESGTSEYEGVPVFKISRPGKKFVAKQYSSEIAHIKNQSKKIIDEWKPERIISRNVCFTLAMAGLGYSSNLLHVFPTLYRMALNPRASAIHLGLSSRLRLAIARKVHTALAQPYERRVLAEARCVVFSQMMATAIGRYYGKGVQIPQVIYPGVDAERFAPVSEEDAHLALSQFFPWMQRSVRYIAYVGRLSYLKNVQLLISMLLHLPDDTQLLIIGSGDMERKMRQLVECHSLQQRVHFLSDQQALLPHIYSLAKVTVLPSLVESFGQVYIESMSSGTPVVGISSNCKQACNASGEIIIDGVNGYLAEASSGVSLANSAGKILSLTETEYSRMSRNARSLSLNKYDWRRFVSALMSC